MIPDSGILTNLSHHILGVFNAGFTNLMPEAKYLLYTLSLIEISITALYWALGGENFISDLIRKALLIGVFSFLVQNWQDISTSMVNGLGQAGVIAGGGADVPSLTNPSAIIDYADIVATPLEEKAIALEKAAGWVHFSGAALELRLVYCLILLAFAIIAFQVFLTYLEFYLVAVLSLLFIACGVFKHTRFLSEKAIGGVLSQGVKLMVLAFILSASMPILQSYTLPMEPTFKDGLNLLYGAAAIAFLAWKAPELAAGMMSGGPSLTAAGAVGTAAGAASGAIAAGSLAGSTVKSGYKATKGIYQGAGALKSRVFGSKE